MRYNGNTILLLHEAFATLGTFSEQRGLSGSSVWFVPFWVRTPQEFSTAWTQTGHVVTSEEMLHCCAGKHVVVEGTKTKASATYTQELSGQIALVIFQGIQNIKQLLHLHSEIQVKGLESQLINEVMQSSDWRLEACWTFRKESHINLLEENSLLRLCSRLAKGVTPVRATALVDSNVVRCATAKGRSSSRGLASILRRVSSICLGAGLYLNTGFVPTRLNTADDPTRDHDIRASQEGLHLERWNDEDLQKLASMPKLKRWASNWARLVLHLLGPSVLSLHDKSQFRQGPFISLEASKEFRRQQFEFDSTFGFPGEGPPGPFCAILFRICLYIAFQADPCRLTFGLTGNSLLRRLSWILWVFVQCCCPFSLSAPVCVGFASLGCRVAMAAPVTARTAGEARRATERSLREPLQLGRQVTKATIKLREKYWAEFLAWTISQDINFEDMLKDHFYCIEEINFVMVKFGRLLYQSGRTYNQYAETLNALGSQKPAIRRMLQYSWDLGYAWVRSEPSVHHVAMPPPILVALLTTALLWGWPLVAGCLAIGFGGLLRPGEITSAVRCDLLLPSDVGASIQYCLLSIREPKSRYTYARHQSAKVDSWDLLEVIQLAFADLQPHQRLWPFGPQTLRTRFKALLTALGLPSESSTSLRCLDLGSLRAGGATFVIQTTENTDLCRRRGRWANFRMMDIYVQETMALQYLKLIPDATRLRVLEVAPLFPQVLRTVQGFVKNAIPEHLWYVLQSRWKTTLRGKMGVMMGGAFFLFGLATAFAPGTCCTWAFGCLFK